MLAQYFRFSEHNTSLRIEARAGLTTFLTMAYIIFVQPAVLTRTFDGKPTGLDAGAVMLATCLASALASLAMGLYARYPIALAPGMGENFFFVQVVMVLAAAGAADPAGAALGVVFLYGVVFFLLCLSPLRQTLIDALSPSLKHALAVGIGLFIAFIGLKDAGLILPDPATLVRFNPRLDQPQLLVFFFGLFLIAALQARRVPGAMIIGILAGAFFALLIGQAQYARAFGLPEVKESALFRIDLSGALSLTALPYLVIFLVMDLFDSVGTLVGVGEQAGLLLDNNLPRAKAALLVDSGATVAGSLLGTSPVTCYIESAAGVAAGGRTGMTSVVSGLLFLAALFLGPLVSMIAKNPAITAPALVMVGALMLRNTSRIDWEDASEAIPAALVILGIPLSYSIANGLSLGFISYPVIKLLSGKGKTVSPVVYLLAVILVLYFVCVYAGRA